MTNIDKIRAALEFAKQCELGLHIKCNDALAALAELESEVAGLRTDVCATSNRLIDAVLEKQSAESERDRLRAYLAEVEVAPTVAVIHDAHEHLSVARAVVRLPPEGTELIARPAKLEPPK